MPHSGKAIALALFVLATSQTVQAQSIVITEPVDWSAQFTGLDGVAIKCIRTIKHKYAVSACKKLTEHAAKSLKKSGVPHVVAGTFYSRDPLPKPSAQFKNPLNVTIHVRATDFNPLGMDVRIGASVSYAAAIEMDVQATPRRGELLMWQHGTTGAGDARRLEPAIVRATKKRFDRLLGIISDSWQR